MSINYSFLLWSKSVYHKVLLMNRISADINLFLSLLRIVHDLLP
jgi:hypothetical protein